MCPGEGASAEAEDEFDCESEELICQIELDEAGAEVEVCTCPEEEESKCSEEEQICEIGLDEAGAEVEVCTCPEK